MRHGIRKNGSDTMKKSCELLDTCGFILNFKSKRITELESRINAEIYPRNSAHPLFRVGFPYHTFIKTHLVYSADQAANIIKNAMS